MGAETSESSTCLGLLGVSTGGSLRTVAPRFSSNVAMRYVDGTMVLVESVNKHESDAKRTTKNMKTPYSTTSSLI